MHRFLPKSLFSRIFFRGNPTEPSIYLTFDDGPHPEYTPMVLDLLAKYRAAATFFITGEKAERNSDLVRAIQRQGHTVANHGLTHDALTGLNYHQILQDIVRSNDIIESIIQAPMMFFRPPYGRLGWNGYRVCRDLNLKIVLWDVIPHDYRRQITPEKIEKQVVRRIRFGSIVLLHDGLPSAEKLVAALPKIIETVRDQGFTFRNLNALLKS